MTPWLQECWEPNSQRQLWAKHPSPEDNGYRLRISTHTLKSTDWRLSINLRSILSTHVVHLEKKKNWDMSQQFSTPASRQLSGSWCPPVVCGVEIAGWQTAHFPAQSLTQTFSWRRDGFTTPTPLSSPGTLTCWNSPELQGLRLPLTWVFLNASVEQNWTFQTGKEWRALQAGFKRAKLILKDYWWGLPASWQCPCVQEPPEEARWGELIPGPWGRSEAHPPLQRTGGGAQLLHCRWEQTPQEDLMPLEEGDAGKGFRVSLTPFLLTKLWPYHHMKA